MQVAKRTIQIPVTITTLGTPNRQETASETNNYLALINKYLLHTQNVQIIKNYKHFWHAADISKSMTVVIIS